MATSRGKEPLVSFSHHRRCWFLERRLYRGERAAIIRSSRTCASRSVAHSIPLTPVATRTISWIRVRCSVAEKYEATLFRRFRDLPT